MTCPYITGVRSANALTSLIVQDFWTTHQLTRAALRVDSVTDSTLLSGYYGPSEKASVDPLCPARHHVCTHNIINEISTLSGLIICSGIARTSKIALQLFTFLNIDHFCTEMQKNTRCVAEGVVVNATRLSSIGSLVVHLSDIRDSNLIKCFFSTR